MKKILFAASEGNPFMKTGGLADVVGALPKNLDQEKFDVRVILPKYLCISEEARQKMKYVTEFYASMPREKEYIGIYEAKVEGIQYYFIDNEHYFAGNSPYNQIFEDVNKFAFFCRAVLACLPELGFCPDIIHCHDWQAALIPVFLDAFYRENPYYRNIRTVMTIHNQKFQGRWRIDDIENCRDLPENYRYGAMEAYGETNFLKAGILHADWVNAVSETYAKEIQGREGGEGLDGVMREVSGKLSGIVNGIDVDEYDPMADPQLAAHFNVKTMSKKKKNKEALQEALGLRKDGSAMVIGMVSRLTQQKGFDLVRAALEELLNTLNIQVALLGTGEEQFENFFRHFDWKYPDRVSATIGYS